MRGRAHGPSFLLVPALLLAAAATAGAQAPRPEQRLRGFGRFGIEGGGDKVLEFKYEDGSSPDVKAGNGLNMTVGGALRLFERTGHAFDAQVGAGIKWSTIPAASNQDLNWLRLPVEALVFYQAPSNVRVGAGLTTHLANKIRASGDVADGNIAFGGSTGAIVQAEYALESLSFDLRYTRLTYEPKSSGAPGVNASSFGGGISFFFGRKPMTAPSPAAAPAS